MTDTPTVEQPELERLQKDAGTPHLPTQLTYELRWAVSGKGPRAYDWSDKPHRLLYDACREIERLVAQQPRPDASVDGLAGELRDSPLAALGTNKVISYGLYERILAALTTREAVVEDDATVERVDREELYHPEISIGQTAFTPQPDRVAQVVAWQPIETAPKDGSYLRVRYADGSEKCDVYWADAIEAGEPFKETPDGE